MEKREAHRYRSIDLDHRCDKHEVMNMMLSKQTGKSEMEEAIRKRK